jgi:preprotein translocase subunit YajC
MGNAILAATSTGKSSNNYFFLVAIVALFGLLYFVTIRPQRNRQRAAMATQRALVPGMRVRTTAGMYATVVSVEDQEVVLEIAPGVNARFVRRAILDVVSDPGETRFAEPPADESTRHDAEDDATTGG